jgi:hypothetical protein
MEVDYTVFRDHLKAGEWELADDEVGAVYKLTQLIAFESAWVQVISHKVKSWSQSKPLLSEATCAATSCTAG